MRGGGRACSHNGRQPVYYYEELLKRVQGFIRSTHKPGSHFDLDLEEATGRAFWLTSSRMSRATVRASGLTPNADLKPHLEPVGSHRQQQTLDRVLPSSSYG